MRTLLRGAATFVVGLTVAALPLAAQTVEFSGNGTVHRAVDNMQAGDVFSFQYFLPQSPTLDPGDVFPQHFTLTSVTGTLTHGGMTYASTDDISFNVFSSGGGFTISSMGEAFGLENTQLFTGTTSAPTLTTGSYDLVPNLNSFAYFSDATISSVTTTPEPGSMVLLGTGLMGLVPNVRRRRM